MQSSELLKLALMILRAQVMAEDGAQSPTRRLLLPDATSDYAGYVAWRGTLDEAVAPAELARFFDDTFTFSEARSGGHILVYYIPGASADSTRGKRRLNWVWYVGADDADLERWLTGRDGQRHHNSLPLGGASEDVLAEIRARALGEVHPRLAELVAATPEPFLQTIVDIGVSLPGIALQLGQCSLYVCSGLVRAAHVDRLTFPINSGEGHDGIIASRPSQGARLRRSSYVGRYQRY